MSTENGKTWFKKYFRYMTPHMFKEQTEEKTFTDISGMFECPDPKPEAYDRETLTNIFINNGYLGGIKGVETKKMNLKKIIRSE